MDKDTERTFTQRSQLEHIKLRPNMYIGSISLQKNQIYVVDGVKFKLTDVEFSPGLLKIFDEILVNAIDHYTNHPDLVKNIDIAFDIKTGEITVRNDGPGISVVKVNTLNNGEMYKPQAVFSEFLSGDNLTDNTDKIVGGTNGLGSKCIANNTPVPLFDGTVKEAKDIKIGELLIGDDGNKRKVLSITNGKGPMYEISQSRGENYIVNDEHILTLHMPDHKVIFWNTDGWSMLYWDRKINKIKTKSIKAIDIEIICEECDIKLLSNLKRHYKRLHPDVEIPIKPRASPNNTPDMSNKEIADAYAKIQDFAATIGDDSVIDISIKEYLSLPKTQQNRLAGVRGECVNWEHQEVHLDPYVLGLWLGDGDSSGYGYTTDISTDKEVLNYLIKWGGDNDATFTQSKTNIYRYAISSITKPKINGHAPLKKLLEKYNLINNKHVPKEYLVNSREVRLKVLAGLIDTDGHVLRDGTRISISQGWKNKKVIDGALFLARSLGFCCSMTSRMAKYKLENGEKRESHAYYLNISGNITDIPTLIPRKKCANPKKQNTDKSTGQITITPVADMDYVGFQIDENQRFLINDFTSTHNCTNAYSDYFQVETYDAKRKIYYTQSFEDRLTIINEPELISEGEHVAYEDGEEGIYSGEAFTEITFLPSYTALGYPKYTEEIGKSILLIIESRAYQTVIFVGKECSVSLNDDYLRFETELDEMEYEQYVKMFVNNDYGLYTTTLKHPKNKNLDMHIGLAISDGKFMHTSIINGISVYEGGTHIKYFSDEIVRNLKPKVEHILIKTKSKFNPNFILNNLFISVVCSVPSPEFNSQGKEKLTTPIDKFECYKFKDKEWKAIWELLEPHITESILGKLKDKAKTRVTRSKIFLKKGSDAKFAGDKKKGHECSLFIAEGDSALGLLETGINHKRTELNRDYCGTWSIQGVCPNARKEVSIIEDKKNGKIIRLRNDKLRDNKRFNELVQLTGLDYEKTYDNSAEGDAEFKTLRYGRIVVATDADTDGKGMIFGLIMNFFALFWPSLIERGYLKRFNTPIIRAYPKDAKSFVKEFYAIHNYNDWIDKEFNGDNEMAATKYDIKYYKGLGGNSADEIKPMFNKFETKLNTYTHDEFAQNNLEIYFGKDTAPRKEELATPVSLAEIEKCDNLKIPVSSFLKTDVKEFQRDNIIRKLPHIMDGMVPSRRKAFFGARLNKKMATSAIKVVNFTGEVISKTGYTHGDMSLSNTIIKMAQCFVGAKNLPLLIGVGAFGSRRGGGTDHASPRYISIKLNKALSNAIFPTQDDFLLKYMFEDGDRVEPEYYVPIIPMSILESMQIPATGWRVKIWARDFTSVLKNVRRMVNGEIKKCRKLGIWLRGNNCSIRVASDGREYMVGKYTYDEKSNVVTITDLPLSVYNDRYIKNIAFNKDGTLIKELKDKQDHSGYDEKTNIDHIDIRFELSSGGMDMIKEKYTSALNAGRSIMPISQSDIKDTIESDELIDEVAGSIIDPEEYVVDPLFDPIEEFFKLRLRIDSDINMINQNGEVREISHYGTVVNIWFEERKKLYRERIERYIILSKLMIKYLENIIRFSEERDSLKITNKTLEQNFNDILAKNKYDKFNKSLLMNPKYCPVGELETNILGGNASYEYIIGLTYRSLLKESCVKRLEELGAEKQRLAELLDDVAGPDSDTFTGQKTWLKELNDLEKIVKSGIENGWDLKKVQPKFE